MTTARTAAARLATAALIAGTAAAAAAQELTPVSFGTNWLAQAEHGGFYQSVADGTYAACGLDVTIVSGGPQVNNRALLIAGKMEFHMGGNMLQPFSAVEQGIPVKVVSAIFQKEPQVIMAHPGKAATFADLKKLDPLLIGENGFQSFYQWMMAEYGFTAEQRAPYTFNPAPFLANENAGQQGYVTSEPFAIEREGGFKPAVFLLADAGFSTYATTIEARTDYIEANPDKVQCFVDGSAIGWYNYLYGDPSAANALIKEANPDISDEQIAFSIAQMKAYGIVDSGDAETLGVGAMTAERHKDFYDKMVAAGVANPGLDVTETYVLDFVNKGVGLDVKKALLGQ